MSIEISSDTISKLEHSLHEIRKRTLGVIQSKFQCCRTDLSDLNVDAHLLIKGLLQLFPQTKNQSQIFEILLGLIKSKYQDVAIRTLSKSHKHGELQMIGSQLSEIPAKKAYNEIIETLHNNKFELDTHTSTESTLERIDPLDDIKWNDHDINANICGDNLEFEEAWEVPEVADKEILHPLKESLGVDKEKADVEHAVQYFQQHANDFPGEFFLQSPFIYASLLDLLSTDDKKINHKNILNCCLKLTKNLERRVNVRKLSDVYCPANKRVASKVRQVTIASYCYQLFTAVLNHLRNIYATDELVCVNECFSILIEIVELICKAANVYTPEVAIEYHIDYIIEELGEFLQFIRESTHDYKRNTDKTNRNNSVSTIFLLCRLLLFKDSFDYDSTIVDSHCSQSSLISDAPNVNGSIKASPFNPQNLRSFLKDSSDSTLHSRLNETGDGASDVSCAFVTAADNINSTKSIRPWKRELELALADYPLKHFYPDAYQLIAVTLKIENLPDNDVTKVLMNFSQSLSPAVKLLKNPQMCSPESILKIGLESINVLQLVNSDELTQKLFETIASLSPQYNGSAGLREKAETLLLNLFCHDCLSIKRLAYELSRNKMTEYFQGVMSGNITVSKSRSANINRSNFFGLPLTSDILIEIISNGLTSEDKKIAELAENLVFLVLRSREIIQHHCSSICEFLIPVLPLLLCFARTSSKLGKMIFALMDPDADNKFSTCDLLKGNVAMLFCRDKSIQSEAVLHLLYIVQSMPNAELYLPNISYIRDIVPNNLCSTEPFSHPNFNGFDALYTDNYIQKLLDVIINQNSEPSDRFTSLNQLNLVLQDQIAADKFCKNDCVAVVLTILDKSLREESYDSYANNAIPIIGILTKLCIRNSAIRRQLASDMQTYVLLIRSLLLFSHIDEFKQECSILLFSIAFNDYIVGTNSNANFIVPPLCRKLCLPIECEFRWQPGSKSQPRSPIESILFGNSQRPETTDLNANNAIRRYGQQWEKSLIWRYIRFTFAALWFETLDKVPCVASKPDEYFTDRDFVLSYKTNDNCLEFSEALCLTPNDLKIIESTSPQKGIHYWLKKFRNATTSNQATYSMAALENFSNVDAANQRKHWDYDLFLHGIKRYCSVIPNGRHDESLFRQLCHLLINLVERDFLDIHLSLLCEFQSNKCIFLDILSHSGISTPVFVCNAYLIEAILAKTMQIQSKKLVEQLVNSTQERSTSKTKKLQDKRETENLYEQVFHIALQRLDSLLNEKKIDELRALVSLLRLVSSSDQVSLNATGGSAVANKILRLILAVKSYSRAGSNFNKNCLLTIGNLMIKMNELSIDKKYIALLSGLCSNSDFELRAYSWSIILKIATTSTGAEQLVKEMSILPGGLHACCLSTLFDETETAMVREKAAFVFATLISYRKTNGEIPESILPRITKEIGGEPIEWFLTHYDLFGNIINSISQLFVEETVESHVIKANAKIVPCNLMRSYCVILSNLLTLKGICSSDLTNTIVIQLIKIIPRASNSLNPSSVALLTDVCSLILGCLSKNKSLIDRVAREIQIVHILISLLNIKLFQNIPKRFKHSCWAGILKMLRVLSQSSLGFETICDAYQQNQNYLQESIVLFIYGLASKDINVSVMKYIITLLVMSQCGVYKFETFSDQLNELIITPEMKAITKQYIFETDNISQSIVNWLETSDIDEAASVDSRNGSDLPDGSYAPDILYKQLSELYIEFSESIQLIDSHKRDALEKHRMHDYVCKTLEAIFKCSYRVRALGTAQNFLLCIVEQIENICKQIGGNFNDYARHHGSLKAEKMMQKLKLQINIILNWYSCDCLHDEDCILALINICQKLWPSIGVSTEVQTRFVKMLKFISDDSLLVCKKLATYGTPSLLSLIGDFCAAETGKPKNSQASLDILELALNVLSNCCSCVEGRSLIKNKRVLYTLSRLHPQTTRNQKPWPQVTLYWLQFFEVITRYQEQDSNSVTHLSLLCNLAEHNSARIRQLALEILRNMSFGPANRSSLLNSVPFLNVVYETLNKKKPSEQLLATVAIWQLIAQNFKGKSIIKNSKIYGKLCKVKVEVDRFLANNKQRRDKICDFNDDEDDAASQSSTEETMEDLSIALQCVIDILDT